MGKRKSFCTTIQSAFSDVLRYFWEFLRIFRILSWLEVLAGNFFSLSDDRKFSPEFTTSRGQIFAGNFRPKRPFLTTGLYYELRGSWEGTSYVSNFLIATETKY